MSTEPTATPSATPAVVAPVIPSAAPAPQSDPRLPEGVVVKNNYADDIEKFFDGPEGKVTLEAPMPTPTPAATPTPQPGNLADKLSAKIKPAAPVTPTPAPASTPAASSPEDAIATVEKEMMAHNPKWKPAQGWNVLKESLKSESTRRAALEQEVTTLKTKISTPGAAGVTVEEVESLRAREKAASDRLLILDLESHPTFKAQFVQPKAAEIARATEILNAHNVKLDVASLLNKPRAEIGKAVAEAIKDVPEFDRVEVADAIRKAYTLEQSAREALGKSKELAGALQQQSVERQRRAFASRWAPVSAAIGEFAQPVETPADATPEQRAADAAYNADLAGLRERAESIALAPSSEEAVAESAIKAAAYDLHINRVLPRVISEYETVVNLNRQLVAELNAIRGRNPNRSINPTPASNDNAPSDPAQMTHAQAAEHFFR